MEILKEEYTIIKASTYYKKGAKVMLTNEVAGIFAGRGLIDEKAVKSKKNEVKA
jgi:hypothetical protein